MKKSIAINIQNKVQFFAIKPYMDLLDKENIEYDIYVPKCDDEDGFGKIFNDLAQFLKDKYLIKRKSQKNISYTILLEPYPMDNFLQHNYEFRIKYKYGPLSAKPNPVYKPESNLVYDAIFCYGNYEASYIKCYAEPYIIENLKYLNFKNHKKGKKLNLLYLPTYGDLSSIKDTFIEISKLSNKYNIIVKAHHGTSFLNDEKVSLQTIKSENNIKFYDLNTPIVELLAQADVVLSDNSGSIFESIYAGIPVCICANNINPKLANFDSSQYEFVQKGYIPYTKNPQEIETIIKQSISTKIQKKQAKLKDILFAKNSEIDGFIHTIKMFLEHRNNERYKELHNILIDNYFLRLENIKTLENNILNKDKEIEKLYKEKKIYEGKIAYLKQALVYYENGKLYKIAKKIYELKNKIVK